jgi:hypothetical protein
MLKIEYIMKSGIARMHDQSGAISVYIDKELAEFVTLPRKTRLIALWNEDTEELIIKKMS